MIQYIVAAGIGGLLGLRRKKRKKFASGGRLSEFDAIERNDVIGYQSSKGEILNSISRHLEDIGFKIVEKESRQGYEANEEEYQLYIEPVETISDAESESIDRFFRKIDTKAMTRNLGESMLIEFTLD